MSTEPSIVFTGATGFIGRRVAPRLAEAVPAASVTCLVRDLDDPFERDGRRVLDGLGLPCMEVDLVTGRGLEHAPRSPTVVLHLASSTETREADHRCIDVGTRNLIDALRPLGPDTHVLYVSSLAVNDERADYSVPLTAATPDPEPPCNGYGRAKLRAERWLQAQATQEGFGLTILRPATVYGSGPRERGMFDSLRSLARRGSWIGRLNWPALTGYVYVDDMADVIVQLAQRPPPAGTSRVHIVAGEHLTLADVSAHIHRALDTPYRPILLPPWFWAACRRVVRYRRMWERVLPHQLYNMLWRVSLIVDPVLWSAPTTLAEALPEWRPSTFEEHVAEVVS